MVVCISAPWKSSVPNAFVGKSSVFSCIRQVSCSLIVPKKLSSRDWFLTTVWCSSNKRPHPHLKKKINCKCYIINNIFFDIYFWLLVRTNLTHSLLENDFMIQSFIDDFESYLRIYLKKNEITDQNRIEDHFWHTSCINVL